jgi:hypothetical protein
MITIIALSTVTVASIAYAIRIHIKSVKFLKRADQIMIDLSKSFLDAGRISEKNRIIKLLVQHELNDAVRLLKKEGKTNGK